MEAALTHHLSQISIRKLKAAVSADAEQYDFGWVVPPLKSEELCFMNSPDEVS
jgi:hypothetical protein